MIQRATMLYRYNHRLPGVSPSFPKIMVTLKREWRTQKFVKRSTSKNLIAVRKILSFD